MSNGIDWDNLGFDLTHVAPMMYMATTSGGEGAVWEAGLRPYGKLEMFPAAQALMYGQSIYEGLKAHRSAKGRIVLFRPAENAARMAAGARRMVMPPFPEDKFVEAVKEVVLANADWVPPLGKGSMYIRPLLMGTGPMLGLNPAPSYTFIIFVTAVGSYFKGGQLSPTNLAIEQEFHRSAPLGGMGGTKAAGNYSPTLFPLARARTQGFTDLLYLDAATSTCLEEGSACNIFAIKGKHVKTPPLNGTILPGVTRKSLLQLARDRGFTVEESPVSAAEAMQADELFTSGTAQVISPVGTLTFKGEKRQFGVPGEPSPLALQLYTALTDIQTERADDPYGWVVPLVEK